MKLSERVALLNDCLFDIELTTSLVEKRAIADSIEDELRDDFNCILEVLNGQHPLGYTYDARQDKTDDTIENLTFRELIKWLEIPRTTGNLSYSNIATYVDATYRWKDFIAPIVNRQLRIGIGASLLNKQDSSPMLAKKFEYNAKFSSCGYYITEKLDGNRCITYFDGKQWVHRSRSGKKMYVEIDMSGMPEQYIYDGELLSPEQVELSDAIYYNLDVSSGVSFNKTSGLINSHTTNKSLIYNIFDIIDTTKTYARRRQALDFLTSGSKQVRILPVLRIVHDIADLGSIADQYLDHVTSLGGEGIMINLGDRCYTQKRSDALLKYKKVQTMDMLVYDTYAGEGKYLGQCGGIRCSLQTEDKRILVDVGSGLSDEQRLEWAIHPDRIIGKLVEIAYFSLSQNKTTEGTTLYSLRFPRLKSIRADKFQGSEY